MDADSRADIIQCSDFSLPHHHLSSVQMEAQWISCHQAPSFSVTMGTASSVSCMLEAMNRELSSLIYLHIEDMEKAPLAYSAAYSDISESRRRIWALLYIRSQCPWIKWLLNPAFWDECEAQNQLVPGALHFCRVVDEGLFLHWECSALWVLRLSVIRAPSSLHMQISTCISGARRSDLPSVK